MSKQLDEAPKVDGVKPKKGDGFARTIVHADARKFSQGADPVDARLDMGMEIEKEGRGYVILREPTQQRHDRCLGEGSVYDITKAASAPVQDRDGLILNTLEIGTGAVPQ